MTENEKDLFKGIYKKYKRRDRRLDTSEVINFHTLDENSTSNVRLRKLSVLFAVVMCSDALSFGYPVSNKLRVKSVMTRNLVIIHPLHRDAGHFGTGTFLCKLTPPCVSDRENWSCGPLLPRLHQGWYLWRPNVPSSIIGTFYLNSKLFYNMSIDFSLSNCNLALWNATIAVKRLCFCSSKVIY